MRKKVKVFGGKGKGIIPNKLFSGALGVYNNIVLHQQPLEQTPDLQAIAKLLQSYDAQEVYIAPEDWVKLTYEITRLRDDAYEITTNHDIKGPYLLLGGMIVRPKFTNVSVDASTGFKLAGLLKEDNKF